MFYSQFILAKKGPLGTIWIAAHLEGKLRKNHVTDTNISASIDSILYPEVPIALRLSGHLLLGVVRIYSRKVNYLFHDCSEALVKIKNAFHCSSVDLPPEASKVPFHSITLPETFNFDVLEASFKWDKLHASSGDYVMDHHVSARDLITLKEQTNEDAQQSLFHQDERFAGSSDPYSILYESDEELVQEHSAFTLQQNGASVLEEDVLPPLQMDGMDIEGESTDFMQQLGRTELSGPSPTHSNQLFDVALPNSSQPYQTKKNANLASGSLSTSAKLQDIPDIEKLRSMPEQREAEPFLMELEEEELVPSSNKFEKTGISTNTNDDLGHHDVEATPVLDETPLLNRLSPSTVGDFGNYTGNEDLLGTILDGRTPVLKVASISREAPESAQQKRGRKKRKVVFDDKPVLSSSSMKKQLAGAADLLRQRRKMPLTEFGVRRMQSSHNGQMFERPSFPGLSSSINELYSCVTRLSAKQHSDCPTPHQDVAHPSINDVVLGTNSTAEVEASLADIGPVDVPEVSSFSPLQFPPNGQQTHNVRVSSADEQSIERRSSGSGTGKQENEDVRESGLGLCDTLPEVPDGAIYMNTDKRLFDKEVPEALATQTYQNTVGVVVKPLHSPSSPTTTPGQVLEKLDFLEDNREKALFHSDGNPDGYDRFVDERNTSYLRRAKENQQDSGWSVRTKCVAKYLKSIFEEAEPPFGSQVSLDGLLKGRTRKEAARMYFETLVLKSRDYIHVEQRSGFAEIMLSATPLLKKDIL